ncbi:T7SS effector LXG polymorphic toxin [Staphylococcus caprae]|uniref:T7SS effector LXG polymorphic toxin n=1 Tax=Staphylococcus caprae TaxID=29380 RepID=UPI003B222007
MGNKVKMAEVHSLQKAVNSSLNNLSNDTKTLENNLNQLKSDDNFKGETASSINAYNDSFHIETIHRIGKIKDEFESKFKSAINAFHSDVDNNHSAILDEDGMYDYRDDLKNSISNIEQSKNKLNSTIKSVQDITEAKVISSNSVKEKGDDLTKFIENTIDDFKDFQAKHDMDDAELLDMIAPVATMTSKVKDMPSNRSTIPNNAGRIANLYTFHSKDNQFIQMKKELDKYRNAVYGGEKGAKVTKTILEIKNHILAAYIAGDGNFEVGNKILASGKIGQLGSKKLKLINATLNTNMENIQGKRLLKASKFLLNKKGMKMSDKFANAIKMTQNFDDTEFKSIQKAVEKYTNKNPLRSGAKAGLDKIFDPTVREAFKNRTSIKNFTLDKFKEFKSLNKLGQGLKLLKYGSKALGPIGIGAIIASNAMSNKSKQRKIVDTTVDLGAMGASAATGLAVGTAIGGPVGAIIGGAVGLTTGFLMDYKIGGKSLTDVTKEKANQTVNRIKNSRALENAKNSFGNSLRSVFS